MKDIRHCGMVITDLEKANYFYTQLLELKLFNEDIETGEYIKNLLDIDKLSWKKYITDNGDIVELYYLPDYDINNNINNKNHIAFTVLDLKLISERMKRNDISHSNIEINKDKTCKVMFCRDPFNNLLELVEEIEK